MGSCRSSTEPCTRSSNFRRTVRGELCSVNRARLSHGPNAPGAPTAFPHWFYERSAPVRIRRRRSNFSTVDPPVLKLDERHELERHRKAQTTSHRDRQYAEVVLLAEDGITRRRIGPKVGLSQQTVCTWRRRFHESGIKGLDDAPRSGRPPVYGPTDWQGHLQVLRTSGRHLRAPSVCTQKRSRAVQ
jgi:hypothetical protein